MSHVIDLTLFTQAFVTLWVIMDPPGTIPVFLALTSTMGAKQRSRAALQAVAVAFGVIVTFALFGQQLLAYMGISLAALQASGGLLLLIVAMQLLTGHFENGEATAASPGANVALVPLGTPLLAGPGAIVATMVFVQQAQAQDEGLPAVVAIAAAIVLVHVSLYLAMRFAEVLHRVLKDSGVTLITRIAGILLAAIAVQQIADAVIEFVQTA
ncbi:MarC family protein [Isoptericola aurantiacus]|uniref:MarC family protein n=1 Tax=Isoptericola aurantiacus TaxID=3377839 RepID=UPI00383BAF08